MREKLSAACPLEAEPPPQILKGWLMAPLGAPDAVFSCGTGTESNDLTSQPTRVVNSFFPTGGPLDAQEPIMCRSNGAAAQTLPPSAFLSQIVW